MVSRALSKIVRQLTKGSQVFNSWQLCTLNFLLRIALHISFQLLQILYFIENIAILPTAIFSIDFCRLSRNISNNFPSFFPTLLNFESSTAVTSICKAQLFSQTFSRNLTLIQGIFLLLIPPPTILCLISSVFNLRSQLGISYLISCSSKFLKVGHFLSSPAFLFPLLDAHYKHGPVEGVCITFSEGGWEVPPIQLFLTEQSVVFYCICSPFLTNSSTPCIML